MIKNFNEFKKWLNESNILDNNKSVISHILENTYPDISDSYLTKMEEFFSLCKDASTSKDGDMKSNFIKSLNVLLVEIDWSKVHYFYNLKLIYYIGLFKLNKTTKVNILITRLDKIYKKIENLEIIDKNNKKVKIIDKLISYDVFFDFIDYLDIEIGMSNNKQYYLYKYFEKYDNHLPKIIIGQEEVDKEVHNYKDPHDDYEDEGDEDYNNYEGDDDNDNYEDEYSNRGDEDGNIIYTDYEDGPTIRTSYTFKKQYIVNGKVADYTIDIEKKYKIHKDDFKFVCDKDYVVSGAKRFIEQEYKNID